MIGIPFFSVIIPTFNRARVLERAIESVLNQSFKDFELLIVDDGSTDNTKETVFSIFDSRISYSYQTNKGVCAARNNGTSASKGKYLLFLDSDDSLHADALQTIFDSAEKSGFPDLIFSDLEKRNLNGFVNRITARDPYSNGNGVGVFLAGAFAIDKEFFINIGGFDEKIKFGENAELKIRIEKEKFSYSITDRVSAIYNENPNGGGSNLENRLQSNEYIINKHREFFSRNKRVLKLYLQSNAVTQARLGRIKDARVSVRRAFVATPLDPSLIIRLIIMHIPFLAKMVWR